MWAAFPARPARPALVDKVAPVISKVEQQPDSGHTEMTLAVTATDADSGVKGYAVTTEEKSACAGQLYRRCS